MGCGFQIADCGLRVADWFAEAEEEEPIRPNIQFSILGTYNL